MHIVVPLLGIAACTQSVATTRQGIIGGTPDTTDTSVVAVTIEGGRCSGVAVAPRVVMTAAHCGVAGVERANPGTVDFADIVPSIDTANIIDIWIDRQYDSSRADHDVALLRIDRDAPAVTALMPTLLDQVNDVRLVGYGEAVAGEANTYGTRRSLDLFTLPGTDPTGTSIVVLGSLGASSCTGDSGGAAFGPAGLLGVVSSGTVTCDGAINVAVPGFEQDVQTVIQAWSGPCPADGVCDTGCIHADPDCDPCAFEGTCQKDCPKPDLDCPVDGGLGATCVLADECETRVCIPAPEGADRGSYCSSACITVADCKAPLDDCENGVCVYPGGTPGIPGAACTKDTDCRTLLCDDGTHTCAVQCGPDYSCPVGLLCEPVRNARACTAGSACNAGGGRSVATCIVILALVGIGRQTRRRRR